MKTEAQTKICQNCKNEFVIEPNDFGFYEKIKVPPPTFCYPCRRQRRWAWRNNMSLYNRKCDLCEKPVVSIYSPDSGLTIYCNKCWWSDKWDPKTYGMDYDFSKPFFTQFNELMKKVPHMAVVNDDGIASLNCEYTHDWWFSKNCYMCFSGWHVENVMYSFFILAGKEIMDCMNIRSKSEWLYECMIVSKSYQVKYSQFCLACIDSQFLFNCLNCNDCFMCVELRNKKYYFKNKQYTKEEYTKILESYRLDTFSGVEKAQKEFNEFAQKYPRKYAYNFNNTSEVTGDTVSYSKNVKDSFLARNSENCRYGEYYTDDKDCYDIVLTGESSECYDCVTADQSQLNFWGLFSVKSQDLRYTQHCHSSKHLFGCVGMRNGKYSILNKEYSKQEYEKLAPKIIEHMKETGEYGEFYPIKLSPFGYNESCATEINPLTKEETLKKGYRWEENLQRTTHKETLKPENIPDSINEVGEGILEEVLACIDCHRNYKIVPNELIFYRKMKIPIPRKCFYCRHMARVARQNPFTLWHRKCMCDMKNHDHNGNCKVEFETTYAPDRPELVYCEKCYQSEVY